MSELPKTFDPAAIEQRWYDHWESEGLFRPDRPDEEPWTIVMPPPNVTGSLHIGHALDNTLQDVLTRRERMRGKDALWVVGTDHAGIATQMVVERNLESQGVKRAEIGREAFLDHVWEWKAQSGGAITRQLRRLGASCDWSNERFTMDPGFSKAVIKVFVELYNRKLIYRAKRLVNWDPKFQTAISDLEVENREVQGHMWHFKYPLAGGETYTYVEKDEDGNVTLQEERDYISIATTRPETMLGDGAVAVHPGDERYRPIVGKLCEIPVGPKEHRRLIPIITDDYPDPNFGSGAVKITGAHDLNDYGVAQRNGIPMYRLMDGTAHMRSDGPSYEESAKRAVEIARGATASAEEVDALNLVPEEYRGMDRYDARKAVVADIDAEGLMVTVEDKMIMQPFGDRSGLVIEPMLTDQWYVDAETLAKPAIEAVRSGDIAVVPETWKKTWFNWLENIQPWCVSRQLWWGHRIPAWYGPIPHNGGLYLTNEKNLILPSTPAMFVAESVDEALIQAANYYADAGIPGGIYEAFESKADATAASNAKPGLVPLWQDNDVLDTWFSSALWPFATLGWPEETHDLKRHYPNDVLISGFDIIFFWDARMAMQGFEFMGERPWKTLYLHGLVRDAKGQKMSKSKGNTVDPLGLIDKYGADALRFTMAAMESQGRDIKLDEKRVEGYRNFATKLWNAARFLQMNSVVGGTTFDVSSLLEPLNRKIVTETSMTRSRMDLAIGNLRFDEYANAIYHFVWSSFCDRYVEVAKDLLASPETESETRAVAGWVLDQVLIMLHPLMPFITEELWHATGERAQELIVSELPDAGMMPIAPETSDASKLYELLDSIRSARAELNVPAGARLDCYYQNVGGATYLVQRYASILRRQARVGNFFENKSSPSNAKMIVTVDTATFEFDLTGVIDVEAEKGRLSRAAAATEKERDSLTARLSNPAFTERAKPEAVEKARSDHAEKSAEADRYRAALERLG